MLDEVVEFKNREITANVVSLIKKNELLTNISKDLLEIEKKAVLDETKSAIHEIGKKIIKTRDVEIWKDFDVRFRQVHSQFYNQLISLFPDLTPSEQRLCALLRMNLNTKEISELMGLHPRSIDNARFKLRKKLNLTPKQNLVSFLIKLS
jgi:DNA-binding CsgD family transcriptional regulator